MKKLNPIFTLILILISALTLYAKDNSSAKIEINVADPKVKAQIIKANNFTGYKGNVAIKVENYDIGYGGYKNGEKNINVTYKAYIDITSTDNQKIIFYKSAHAPQLEYSLIKGKLKVIYDGKDITTAITTDKDFLNTYKLYKYPYNFISEMITAEQHSAQFKKYVNLFNEPNLKQTVENYYDMSTSSDGYFVVLNVDTKYRILELFVEDNGNFYTWKNNVPYIISIGRMAESISTTFLDKNGWVKK